MDTKIPACSSHLLDPVSVSSNSEHSAKCRSDLWMVESAAAETQIRRDPEQVGLTQLQAGVLTEDGLRPQPPAAQEPAAPVNPA